MNTISSVLIILLAVVISGFIARALPIGVPRPLVQIAIGGLLGTFADLRMILDPQIFFLLFLPPLLFLDGWRIPRDELMKDARPILEMAMGLVLFTVVGIGFFLHWLIPGMPLPVAFALAAVLSPTDPIAVSAIAARVPIPPRLMHILEGESLLNDATGLVCLRFAIAAAMTGVFSIYDATLSFVWVALGGLAIGILTTLAIVRAKQFLVNRIGEETGSQILISVLMPFAAYLLAEHLHCSGILAAVAAGVTMSRAETSGRAQAVTRVRRGTVWDMIQFALSGIIFVLLGEQLPDIIGRAVISVRQTGHQEPWWLLVYVVIITLSLGVLRFVWVWLSLQLTLLRHRSRFPGPRVQGNRLVLATTLAGARGAITLAGVLTLPMWLPDGSPFPARDLAICLAMGVIILSLVIASVCLPMVLRNLVMPEEDKAGREEAEARLAAAQAAVAAIGRVQQEMTERGGDAETNMAAATRVMESYRGRIELLGEDEEGHARFNKLAMAEAALRLAAVRAERSAIITLARSHRIGTELARALMHELDLTEARLTEKDGH